MSESRTHTIENAPVALVDEFSEETLIAALLVDGTQVGAAVLEKLEPGHFWHTFYEWIFAAMLTLRERGEDVDYASVVAELTRCGQLKNESEILQIIGITQSGLQGIAGVRGLARRVRKVAERRALLQFCSEVATRVQNDLEAEPVLLWSEAMDALTQQRPFTGNNDLLLGSASVDYYERHLDYERENPVWYPSPWKALADAAPVHKPGDIIVIAGPEGSGKSAMALNWAQFYAARLGHRVLYAFTEMDKANVLARRAVMNSHLSYARLLTPDELSADEMAALARADDDIRQWAHKLDLWEAGAIQARELLNRIKQHVDAYGTQVVIIDGLNDLGFHIPKSGTLAQATRDFMAHLETFARDNNLLIVATAQLNREGQEYGSSAYRQKAALLLRIEAEKAQMPESVSYQGVTYGCQAGEYPVFRNVVISKNRRGKSGHKARLAFIGARFLWIDPPPGTNITDALDAALAAPASLDLGGAW